MRRQPSVSQFPKSMRRKVSGPPSPARGPHSASTRGIRELERFSCADLENWERASRNVDELHSLLYFGPEAQRASKSSEIVDALRQSPGEPIRGGQPWVRIVDYRYGDDPLSPIGSLCDVGGRFNVGRELEEHGHAAWPALYIAQDYPTAYFEKFLTLPNGPSGELEGNDFALQRPGSFVSVNVTVDIEHVFDLRTHAPLEPLVKVIKNFRMPARVHQLVKRLKLQRAAAYMIKSAPELLAVVMSQTWRLWSMQFDLPAQSQVLARYVALAGYEAIRYRSCKGQGDCLALLCRNLIESSSFVELRDPPISGIKRVRFDRSCAGMY